MWIDIGVLGFLVFSIFRGYRKGFGKSLANLVSWIVAIIAAYYLSYSFKDFLMESSVIQGWIDSINIEYLPRAFSQGITSNIASVLVGIIAFLLIIIIVKILVKIFFSLFKFVKRIPTMKFFNKIFGAIFGFSKGIIILWILALFMLPLAATMGSGGLTDVFNDSQIISALYKYNSTLGMF